MTYYSSVPAAVTALVTAFRASAGLAGVLVLDGPGLNATAGVEGIAVGWSGDPNAAAVTGTAAPEGMGAGGDREQYTVACTIMVIDPGGDITAARTRAYQLHAACGAAIAADHTLAGVVLRASLGIGSLTQQQTTGGALARIVFPVNTDAYTTR
jgi:hypothetical protein